MNRYPIHVRAIDHVVLRARDLPAMIAFYSDVLGCHLERGPGDIGLAQLRAGATLVDIVDVAGPIGEKGGSPPGREGRNLDHFCLQVEPWDEGTIREHLGRHGVTAGAAVSRYGAQGKGPSIYVQDPEGNTIELKGTATP
jgi:catechol 2,3-dioxygenase-like lactoylglutathione lyase family enzyme